jgi:hypothetical protein
MTLPPNHSASSHARPSASHSAIASSSEAPHSSGPQRDDNAFCGASDEGRRSTSTLHDLSDASAPAGASEKREGGDKFSRPDDLDAQEKGEGSREKDDGDVEEVVIVDWKGKDDPACPLNWSYGRRMLSTLT